MHDNVSIVLSSRRCIYLYCMLSSDVKNSVVDGIVLTFKILEF